MAKKKTRKNRYKLKSPRKLIRIIAWGCALAFVLLLLRWAKDEGLISLPDADGVLSTSADAGNGEIPRGATIENIAVGGLTEAEAVAKVKPKVEETLASINITLAYGETELTLRANDIGAYSNIEEIANKAAYTDASEDYTLTYSTDAAALESSLQRLRESIDVPPVEPYAVPSLSEGNVQSFAFHPGQNGVSLDSQAMAAAIMQRLAEGEFAFEMQPITTEVSPTFSEQEIQDYTKRIATFTTRFRNSTSMQIIKNRVFNIQKAADIINCMTVEPGSEWSFNTFVGLRTAEGGWKEANGISGGKEYTLQVGGGICQVSTTLYNALLRANIKITDRRAHSIPSDYVDKGLDATVDSGGIDLKFQNDTGYPLYVFAYLKPDPEDSRYATITVSLYGKPLSGGVTYQPRSEISEVIPRDVPAYTEDPNIPSGYQLETVARHDGFVAEVYLDKYVNGAFESSTHLYRDKYRGNVAEISLGTGDPAITGIPENAVPVTGGTGGIPAQTPAVPEPTPTPPPEAAPDMTPNPDGSLG